MNFGKTYLIKSIYILLISTAIISCSQTIEKGDMKFIAKYAFHDFYKDKINVNSNYFLPTDDARFNTFEFLDENTIFLAGSIPKDSIVGQNDFGVIFLSKDKGKSYQQILFPEENVTFVSLSTKYSLIETNSNGSSPKGKNCIYLLDNSTFQFKKIDEYSSNNDINYGQFNGEYTIYSKESRSTFLNVFNKEEYELPEYLKDIPFILKNNNTIVYVLKNEIQEYNPKTKQQKVIKKLNSNYDVLYYNDGEYTLGKYNLLKTGATIYDDSENELYVLNEKNIDYYRYKNFACVITQRMPKYSMRYSYDYGKTWKEYSTEDFITTSIPKGFYKDKYIFLDAGFYRKKNSNQAGKRMIVGEFQK